MKLTKIKIIVGIFVMAVSCFSGYRYAVSEKADDGFFCTSDANFHESTKTLNATINFHMQEGQGFLTLEGAYYESKIKISTLSLRKQFSYHEKYGEYLMTQNSSGVLEVSEKDRMILKEFLPEFYINNNIPYHHERIKKLRKGLWIFTTTPVPDFVCTDY